MLTLRYLTTKQYGQDRIGQPTNQTQLIFSRSFPLSPPLLLPAYSVPQLEHNLDADYHVNTYNPTSIYIKTNEVVIEKKEVYSIITTRKDATSISRPHPQHTRRWVYELAGKNQKG